MFNHKDYSYSVIWSQEDQEYVGLCTEYPSLSYLDENRAQAHNGVIDLVQQVIEDMQENNEPIPTPKKYLRQENRLPLPKYSIQQMTVS